MKPFRVLIVDDNRDLAESLAMVLEGRGYNVELAYSGQQAVDAFKDTKFDIAFMDVKMPGMNGVESYLEIKKMYPDARVVMMTGYRVEQLLEQAVEAGAWGVLHKPFEPAVLIEILEKIKQGGILIVDDDPDFLMSVKNLLTDHGWSVYTASSGQEAIARIVNNGIDILILDIRMPVMNGLETYLELKNKGYVIPTIIVTAFADDEKEVLEQLNKLSVSGVLVKPFDPNTLLSELENLAGVSSSA